MCSKRRYRLSMRLKSPPRQREGVLLERRGVRARLVDIVIPICGIRQCLRHYISDVLRRACQGLRILLISSNSASTDKTVYSRCTTRRRHMATIRRGGKKLSTTHGTKLRQTRKACLYFISDSSFLSDQVLRALYHSLRRRSTSITIINFQVFRQRRRLTPTRLAMPIRYVANQRTVHGALISSRLKSFT